MKGWPYQTPGIPDDRFIRGKVPMTKEEVRVVTLAKLRLQADNIVFDIGAGTGSISIEAALQTPNGKVYAIEKNTDGIELIKQNASLFGTDNLEVVNGEAPEVLVGLPVPDRVIIGGSGGNIVEIIAAVDQILKPNGRIIINAVILETLFKALKKLQETGYQVEVTQVSVSKANKIGDLNMMQAQNPIFIVAAERSQA